MCVAQVAEWRAAVVAKDAEYKRRKAEDEATAAAQAAAQGDEEEEAPAEVSEAALREVADGEGWVGADTAAAAAGQAQVAAAAVRSTSPAQQLFAFASRACGLNARLTRADVVYAGCGRRSGFERGRGRWSRYGGGGGGGGERRCKRGGGSCRRRCWRGRGCGQRGDGVILRGGWRAAAAIERGLSETAATFTTTDRRRSTPAAADDIQANPSKRLPSVRPR